MDVLELFPTYVFRDTLNLNLDYVKHQCYTHCNNRQNELRSGTGFQGSNFECSELQFEILNRLPKLDNKPIKNIGIHMWVNINKKNDYNKIHNHNPFQGNALSGVFYVKAPKDCGYLKLYDPRGIVSSAPDLQYYNDGNLYHYFTPTENMLLIFPAWINHLVDPNQSDDDRISVSFNIKLDF